MGATRDRRRARPMRTGRIMKVISIAAALLCGAAGTALAAPVTFDFTGGPNTVHGSLAFAQGGVSVDVLPLVYDDRYRLDGQHRTLGHWGTGLGVRDTGDRDHKVDGSGDNNAVLFTFDRQITLLGATFSYADADDHVEVFLLDGTRGPNVRRGLGFTGRGGGWSDVAAVDFSADMLTSETFALGATDRDDEWKLSSITVDVAAVPVPAAGVLLLAGLGGLAAMRRRA